MLYINVYVGCHISNLCMYLYLFLVLITLTNVYSILPYERKGALTKILRN